MPSRNVGNVGKCDALDAGRPHIETAHQAAIEPKRRRAADLWRLLPRRLNYRLVALQLA